MSEEKRIDRLEKMINLLMGLLFSTFGIMVCGAISFLSWEVGFGLYSFAPVCSAILIFCVVLYAICEVRGEAKA